MNLELPNDPLSQPNGHGRRRDRMARLRARMRERELPAVLISQIKNVGYLSGFSGSTALLLITDRDARFLTDCRYAIQAERECSGCSVVVMPAGGTYEDMLAAEAGSLGINRLGIESGGLTVRRLRELGEKLVGVTLQPVDDLVEPLRLLKDEDEVALMKTACSLADQAFSLVLPLVRPGIVERDLAIELEYRLKRLGSEKEAFDTIVASGPRSALPHGRAADRVIQHGDFVTFDFGAHWQGYNSDLTRTIVVGEASDDQRKVYNTVLDAQLAALDLIRPGVDAKAVDALARERIADAGYGKHFGHGLGHHLGLDVHDGLGFSVRSDFRLEAGMVLTVEPGIYIDGWGGVRIEDDVLVTHEGCDVMTTSPKSLLEVG